MQIEPRLLTIEDVCTYLGIKRSKAYEIMNRIGAKRKIDGKTLFEKKIIDEYVDSLESGKE